MISSVPVSAPLPTAVPLVSFYGNQQVAQAQIPGAEEDTLQLDVEIYVNMIVEMHTLKCTYVVHNHTFGGTPGSLFEACDAKLKCSISVKGGEVAWLHTAVGSLYMLSSMAAALLSTLEGISSEVFVASPSCTCSCMRWST